MIGYLGQDPTDTSVTPAVVPDAVVIVTSRMVARVLEQQSAGVAVGSEGTTNQAGPFALTTRFSAGTTSGAPWLASSDKVMLRAYRRGGGMQSVALTTDLTGRFRVAD